MLKKFADAHTTTNGGVSVKLRVPQGTKRKHDTPRHQGEDSERNAGRFAKNVRREGPPSVADSTVTGRWAVD